ncbi:MAG: NAD(+) synthase, partial [Clostridia bacterium]|nr:NAD(+) synthase [Clostridia bacterium]
VEKNKEEILRRMNILQKAGVRVALFPEMCLTGYTVGDLVNHSLLQKAAMEAMLDIASQTGDMAVIVGLPIVQHGRLFNCAAVLQDGEVRGIVPKTYLPNGNEFYETRWFVGGEQAENMLESKDLCCAFGSDLVFDMGDFLFAVEICEDLWTPIPPSCKLALEGADIIFNPSASNALACKHAYRRELIKQQSARLFCGYVYAGAGFGESTSDLVFCGYTGVYENGRALAEGKRFTMAGDSAIADVDIERLRYQRQRSGSFHQVRELSAPASLMEVNGEDASSLPLRRPLEKFPFIPKDDMAAEQLEEIVRIQTTGLMTRLNAIGCKKLVIGVSGGLDSTLALLVCIRAFDLLGLDRAG